MSYGTVARRYARALSEEAERDGVTDLVDADIAMIRQGLDDSRELGLFFESPVVSRERKSSVVDALFSERVAPLTLKFLQLLVEKRRESIFAEVVDAYRHLRDEEMGIVPAFARVAHPMTESEERALASSLEEMVGKRVRLESQVDGSLIGGLVVRIGDMVYDGSVSNQLGNLRERLESGGWRSN